MWDARGKEIRQVVRLAAWKEAAQPTYDTRQSDTETG